MLKVLLLISTLLTVQAVKLELKNLEIGPIWVGIQQKEGKALVENGGLELLSGKSKTLNVPDDWAGKFWPRTWCNWPKPNRCLTGECGGDGFECQGNGGISPFSSIDLTLKGEGGYDYYDVSLAHGYNIAVAIEPIKGTRNNSHHFSCSKAACAFNFQQNCPGPLRLRHENQIVACFSPCLEFSADEHCCHNVTGNAEAPEVCKSLEWRDIHPGHFKQFCRDALTYELDQKNIFTCKAETYRITFGGAW